MDSAIPLLSKSEISSLWLSSVAVQPGLCVTWSETPKTGFLTTRLICGIFYTPDGQITAADILSEPIPKKKRKQDDPKEELREQIKTLKPEEIESVDVSIDSIKICVLQMEISIHVCVGQYHLSHNYIHVHVYLFY